VQIATLNSPNEHSAPDGIVSGLWRRFASLRTAGWLLLVAGGLALVSPGSAEGAGGALRGAATLAAFSMLGVALRCWNARARSDRGLLVELASAGLRTSVALPYFREELEPASVARLDAAPRTLPVRGVSILTVLLAIAVPGVLATSALLFPEVGQVSLSSTSDSEVISMVSPAPGAMRNLNARVRLDATALVRGESVLPAVRVRSSGAEGATSVPVTPGDAAVAAQHLWGASALVPSTRIGAATLMATPRPGGDALRVVLRRGEAVTMPDGAVLSLRDGHPSYAGQLGPAVQIVETTAEGAVVRDEWVFGRNPTFDAAHGAGRWALSLIDFALDNDVAFRVSAGAGAEPAAPFVPVILSVFVLVAGVFAMRRRCGVLGRDGDWRIEEYGFAATLPRGPASEFRDELLTDAQRTEIASLEARVAARTS
jgi:hypothetical protein